MDLLLFIPGAELDELHLAHSTNRLGIYIYKRSNDREAQNTIQECQRLVSEDKSELETLEQTLRRLRLDLSNLKRRETAARTTQQNTMQEADELQELLDESKPDSGRVIAYQEAISVMTSMT